MMEKTRIKLNTLLQELAKETGKPDDLIAAKAILRSIIHGLRDSLSIDSSINFLTALPPYLKEVFVEDWKPSQNPLNDQNAEQTFIKIYRYYSINSFPPASMDTVISHYKMVKRLLEGVISCKDVHLVKNILPEIPENQPKISSVAA